MKNVFALTVIALWLTACASNDATRTAGSSNDSATSGEGMPPGSKKVCKYERNTGGTSRMRRVCKYVDIEETDAS